MSTAVLKYSMCTWPHSFELYKGKMTEKVTKLLTSFRFLTIPKRKYQANIIILNLKINSIIKSANLCSGFKEEAVNSTLFLPLNATLKSEKNARRINKKIGAYILQTSYTHTSNTFDKMESIFDIIKYPNSFKMK